MYVRIRVVGTWLGVVQQYAEHDLHVAFRARPPSRGVKSDFFLLILLLLLLLYYVLYTGIVVSRRVGEHETGAAGQTQEVCV